MVVFSEYERMTYLAGEELRKLGTGFVSLHGGVPSRQRGALIAKFQSDPECRVFLSTDAGGVGLNLQAASAVVNFEPPWNPVRLEQRIARVHRLGQSRPVHVIHMLTTDSIEERVWETVRVKKSLFEGVFDSPTAEVSFAKLGRKTVLHAVKEIFANQPGRPKPVAEQPSPKPVPAAPAAAGVSAKPASGLEHAAAGLIEAGVVFLESIAAQGGGSLLSGLVTRDARTNQPVLSIALPEPVSQERLTGALSGLLSLLSRAAPPRGGPD